VSALPAKRILWLVPLLIASLLTLDQLGGAWGQPVASAVTWLSFLWILRDVDKGNRTMMVLCLMYATAGEVVLSLVWHIYDYRLGNLPLFVPPGHVMLFLLGLTIAPHMSDTMVRIISILAAAVVSVLALSGRDTFSALLVAVFLASVVFGRERKLYATMFVLALVMEWYGTWLGNWHWSAQVGRTGMVTLNPPIAAGAFYCALDLLVMSTMRGLARSARPPAASGEVVARPSAVPIVPGAGTVQL
jgi:hypothetical protein